MGWGQNDGAMKLGFAFGLAQAGDPLALFPLSPLFEDGDTFKPFQDIALGARGARGTQTSML